MAWALRPLGFGTTHNRAPSNPPACSPRTTLVSPNAVLKRGDAGDRHDGGRPLAHECSELLTSSSQLVRGEFRRLRCRPFRQVRDPDPAAHEIVTVVVGESRAAVDRTVDHATQEQCRVEAVPRMREVGLRGGGPQPGIDPDEQQAQARSEEVGHGRPGERLQFGTRKSHGSDHARRVTLDPWGPGTGRCSTWWSRRRA